MSNYLIPKEYLFEQQTPASVWVIRHACSYPIVDIFITENGKVEKMIPSAVKYISDSQCEVHFSRPFAGTAKLVG